MFARSANAHLPHRPHHFLRIGGFGEVFIGDILASGRVQVVRGRVCTVGFDGEKGYAVRGDGSRCVRYYGDRRPPPRFDHQVFGPVVRRKFRRLSPINDGHRGLIGRLVRHGLGCHGHDPRRGRDRHCRRGSYSLRDHRDLHRSLHPRQVFLQSPSPGEKGSSLPLTLVQPAGQLICPTFQFSVFSHFLFQPLDNATYRTVLFHMELCGDLP